MGKGDIMMQMRGKGGRKKIKRVTQMGLELVGDKRDCEGERSSGHGGRWWSGLCSLNQSNSPRMSPSTGHDIISLTCGGGTVLSHHLFTPNWCSCPPRDVLQAAESSMSYWISSGNYTLEAWGWSPSKTSILSKPTAQFQLKCPCINAAAPAWATPYPTGEF